MRIDRCGDWSLRGSREKIEKKIVLPHCTPYGCTSGSSVYVTRGGGDRRNYTLQYWWTGSILFTAGRDFVNWKTSARTNKSAGCIRSSTFPRKFQVVSEQHVAHSVEIHFRTLCLEENKNTHTYTHVYMCGEKWRW